MLQDYYIQSACVTSERLLAHHGTRLITNNCLVKSIYFISFHASFFFEFLMRESVSTLVQKLFGSLYNTKYCWFSKLVAKRLYNIFSPIFLVHLSTQ